MDLVALLSTKLPVSSAWSWLPEPASTTAEPVDWLFNFLTWTGGILFLLVVVPLVVFAIRYRRRYDGQRALTQKDHNKTLEILWTVLPLVYLALLFHWGFVGYTKMYEAPVDAKQLRIEGKKWAWAATYPEEDGGFEVGAGEDIVLPLGKPVQLTMHSIDVIHSFFIPNFRVKQDVLPKRYTQLWFRPTAIGEYPVFCAEYCGESHSRMMQKIKVVSEADYAAWLAKRKGEQDSLPPAQLGAKLYVSKGCNACHTVAEPAGPIAPTFKGLYGHQVTMHDGATVTADDNYIRESIVEPQAKIVKGYGPPSAMPKMAITEKEIIALIEFIKTLK